MLFDRTYRTITSECEAIYMDKGSRFLTFVYPVYSELEIKHKLALLKTEFPDATHHCYAWILFADKSAQRLNDDGEPSNTAARPIMKQINALNLTNILVVVIRYFGGKKLGIPGLIEAYGEAAKLGLSKIEVVTKTLMDFFKITTDFDKEHLVFNLARKYAATILEVNHTTNVEVLLSIDGMKTEAFAADCKNLANFELKYIKTE